ncbi:MAG: cofactor-independent phosphoglycerate mutase [Dethiobacter sp.]|jgi:2,3-bisphosphoglycerate-independent phosphoglycerate mutase|nr:cofactor-independent phosphoglycerate mutase [Dethiobacter sp.]
MKYVVILGDGMADYPVAQLGGKTPLQRAHIPNMDYLARHGTLGLVKTVPEGMAPGSDTANLAVLGYDPRIYYSGRSPFEAYSMGIMLKDTDIAFRCNLVTLSQGKPYEERVMLDHGAGEISSQEARELIATVNEELSRLDIKFYPGVGYRHLMVWSEGPYEWKLTPPHDILGRQIKDYLPAGSESRAIEDMMRLSAQFLGGHVINKKREAAGKGPANSIWIWGEGKKPLLTDFNLKYDVRGAVISAVDLIKGMGLCAGMESIEVEGATGNINTNFSGKARAALEWLQAGGDFVYIHIEAPDECAHMYEIENKVKAIELIDDQVVKVIKAGLDRSGEAYKLMVLPDHATPLALRTHTSDPVPFIIYESTSSTEAASHVYDEDCAGGTGVYFAEGHKLMDFFLRGSAPDETDPL